MLLFLLNNAGEEVTYRFHYIFAWLIKGFRPVASNRDSSQTKIGSSHLAVSFSGLVVGIKFYKGEPTITAEVQGVFHDGNVVNSFDFCFNEVHFQLGAFPFFVDVTNKQGLVVVGQDYADVPPLQQLAIELAHSFLRCLGCPVPHKGVPLAFSGFGVGH